MTFTCPAGHASTTGDYCDTCGSAIAPPTGKTPAPPSTGAGPTTPTPTTAVTRCSNCGADRVADDLFCEVCGLDFASGKLPAPPPKPKAVPTTPAAPATPMAPAWTAIVEADRAYFDKNQAEGGVTLAFPEGQAPREVPLLDAEVRVGRSSEAGIDLSGVDPGVSHRHLRLLRTADGDGWEVVDDDSANGTWLDDAAEPIAPGQPVALTPACRIHIGAFTTITLRDDRPATKAEP